VSKLPERYCLASIGDVTYISTGKLDANAACPDGEYPFFTCADETLRINSYAFDTEAILLAGNGGFGVKWFSGKFNAYQRTYVIEPKEIYGRYLYYNLINSISEITSSDRGSTIKYLRLGDITDTKIPIASLNEQKRIADKLDQLLAAVDSCKTRLDTIPGIIKKFRKSVLAAATSGELTADWREENVDKSSAESVAYHIRRSHEIAGGHKIGNAAPPTEDIHNLSIDMFPTGWELLELREIVKPDRPITYGILKPGPELEEGIPYIRVADFPNNQLNLAAIRKTSTSIDQVFKRSRLESGDILLSIRGTVGRLIVIPQALEGANITQDSARLSIQKELNRDYVLWFLRADIAQSRMKNAERGVAVRGINIGDVRALQVAIPSRMEQDEIVRRVEALFAVADCLEARYQTARAQVDQLTPSLLAKAFRGELVSQDPNDEPAEKLLDRIRMSQISGGGTVKKARRTRMPIQK